MLKRTLFMLLALSICLTLIACESNPTESSADESESVSESIDTTKPIIRILPEAAKVIIGKGEDYDLMDGVSGFDNTDGDITDKIVIDKGGFDPDVTGEYTVKFSLTDNAGNAAVSKSKRITVKETDVIAAPEIWSEAIEGEILNPENPDVFGGAWYYKSVSSRDKWVGIETVVTLPQVDIDRYSGDYNQALNVDPNVKNLDNPSIYLGGNAKNESDVGLSFSRALVNVKSNTLSTGSIAFRPFWRYITDTEQDLGGYDAHNGEYSVSANGNNCFANYHWKFTQYYYLPGDKLRIVIYIPEENKMQLQIEVIEKSTLPESVAMREEYGWEDPANFLSPIFTSPGHGTGINAEYKRVCAIDQSGNEGGTAINSTTLISNVIWHETYLYREIDGVIYRVAMNSERRGATAAPEEEYFTITQDGVDGESGGEVVTIHPGYKN